MKNYRKNELRSFADAMLEASEVFRRENPDFIVAPMLGSVPLIDGMATVSNDFDSSKVVYMPASSRISDVSGVIRTWYSNFLNEVVDPSLDRFPKIMGIDEVVSGNSVLRCLKVIDAATLKKRKELRQQYVERVHSSDKGKVIETVRDIDTLSDNNFTVELAEIRGRIDRGDYRTNRDLLKRDSRFIVDLLRKSLGDKFEYRTVGIEDSKREGKRNRNYVEAREAGKIVPVKVQTILTMDNPKFCPVNLKELPVKKGAEQKYVGFSPEVDSFEVSPEYVSFLRSLAGYVGKNPDEVHPVNIGAIYDSSKFLAKPRE